MGTSPAGGVVRGARAAFLSSLVLSLAVCGHVLGGGDWPSAGALGGSALLATVMASVLTRVQLRMGRLVAALAAGQVAVHQLLSLTTGHGTIGHDHAAMAAAEGMPGGSGAVAVDPNALTLRMLAGHAAATMLAAAVVGYGERILWLAWEAIRPRLVALPAAHWVCRELRLAPRAPEAPRPLVLLLTASPRGPPRMATA